VLINALLIGYQFFHEEKNYQKKCAPKTHILSLFPA